MPGYQELQLFCILVSLFAVAIVFSRVKNTRRLINGCLCRLKMCIAFIEELYKTSESSSNTHTNDSQYTALSPIHNADNNRVYINAIEWAFRQKDINNLAVTGPYGSGKTSVLKTFAETHPDLNILTVSLAQFYGYSSVPNESIEKKRENKDGSEGTPGEEGMSSTTNNSSIKNFLIEESILQQILYTEPAKNLPRSRFNRIFHISLVTKIIQVIPFIIAGAALLVYFKFSIIPTQSLEKNVFNPNQEVVNIWSILGIENTALKFFILTVVFISFISIIIQLFDYLRNKGFKKLNIFTGDIEVADKPGASILNIHLDEIIYFFDRTDYQSVLFEDLDRFKSPDIFIKLRELNTLINNSRKQKNRILFIYAVRDDLFDEDSRTKFFDFIIPVIPHLTKNNSRQLLLNRLKPELVDELGSNFIKDITRYISDMRLLLNILNEFFIYEKKLRSNANLDVKKLFAFIVYKNKYPSDFASLYEDAGNVYDAFTINREKLIDALTNELDSNMLSIRQKIEENKKEKITDLSELRAIYLAKLFIRIPHANSFNIGGDNIQLTELDTPEKFELLRREDNIRYNGNYSSNVSFKDIEKSVGKPFIDRRENILANNARFIAKKEEEYRLLTKQKQLLLSRKLSELLQEYPEKISTVIPGDNQLLLKQLIRKGYISENYYDYLSLFHEGVLTKQDKDFLRKVDEGGEPNPTATLNNVTEILEELSIKDMQSTAILNFDLIQHLLQDLSHNAHLDSLLSLLIKDNEACDSFIDGFINRSEQSEKLLIKLTEHGKNLWEFYAKYNYSDEQKNQLLNLLINGLDNYHEVITTWDTLRDISDYVQSSSQLEMIFDRSSDKKYEEVLSRLDVTFQSLEQFKNLKKFLPITLNRYAFELNKENLQQIFKFYEIEYAHKIPNITDLGHNWATAPILEHYFSEAIDTFVEMIILENADEYVDTEESYKWLLEHDTLSTKMKNQLIKNCQFTVTNAEKWAIETNLWPLILTNGKVLPSWNNIFYLYLNQDICNINLTPELEQFLNSYAMKLENNEDSDDAVPDDAKHSFFKHIIHSEEINFDNWKTLLTHNRTRFKDINLTELKPEKIQFLIENFDLAFTEENFINISNTQPKLIAKYIQRNSEEFITADKSNYPLDDQTLLSLLKTERRISKLQKNIIQDYSVNLIAANKQLSKVVYELILKNKDLVVESELLKKLFKVSDNIEEIISIFIRHSHRLSRDEIRSVLSVMGFDKLNASTHTSLSNNKHHKALLDKLVELGCVKDYKPYRSDKKRLRVNLDV